MRAGSPGINKNCSTLSRPTHTWVHLQQLTNSKQLPGTSPVTLILGTSPVTLILIPSNVTSCDSTWHSNNTLRGILWEFEYNAGIDTRASLVLFLKERNLSNDGDN